MEVTEVDFVGRAVRTAQHRAEQTGATVRFVEADVTDLQPAGIGTGSRSCSTWGAFHGLRDRQRAEMGEVTPSRPTTRLCCCRLQARPQGALPRGASSDQVEAALPHRRVVDDTFADITGVPGPLKEAAPRWYRLRRSGG